MTTSQSQDAVAKYIPSHRYRTGRRGNDSPRGGNPRNPNHSSRDGTPGSQQNRRGGKQQQQQQQHVNKSQQQPDASSQNGPAPPTEQHVPLNGFNAAEVEKFLAQGVDAKTPTYKPHAGGEGAKSGNPWGAKPGTMANNKDFWLELRKQVTALQQQGPGGPQGG